DFKRPALSLTGKSPSKDDLVSAIGHSEVSGLWTKSSGLVTKSGATTFQTDAAVSSDFSGGPVLNEWGEVAGILVTRPADTEEGRWPVAVPAAAIARWLDGAEKAATPATEAIEDSGTAAILSRTHPSALTETGLGDWNIPNLPPPPPEPRGVCVGNCGSPPARSYTNYTRPGSSYGSSSYSNNGSAELGEALGKLGAVMILEGIPALFRGIGKLFRGSDKANSPSGIANRPSPAKADPPPKKEPPKPPDPVLTLAVTTTRTDESVIFTARVTGNRDDLKLDGITVDFTVNKSESATADTNASGIAVLTVKNPRSMAALKSLDEESAKHPWLTNASSGITKQGACEVSLIGASVAVAVYVGVRAPVVVLTVGGLALKAPKPAVVKACLGIAGVATAAAAAACTAMLRDDLAKPTEPMVTTPVKPDSGVPPFRAPDDLYRGPQLKKDDLSGIDRVQGKAQKAQDELSMMSRNQGEDAEGSPESKGLDHLLKQPDSLRGASSEEIESLIPKGWVSRPTERTDEEGVIYRDPDAPGRQVRIMKGSPRGHDELHRGPRVIISPGDGPRVSIPLKGNGALEQ
ncbi:MAG: hypothetical protein COV48_10745, partial [Elusimicrobia bacterium CG11_big_fil_rev_8_21_14_0_20_64_6]